MCQWQLALPGQSGHRRSGFAAQVRERESDVLVVLECLIARLDKVADDMFPVWSSPPWFTVGVDRSFPTREHLFDGPDDRNKQRRIARRIFERLRSFIDQFAERRMFSADTQAASGGRLDSGKVHPTA